MNPAQLQDLVAAVGTTLGKILSNQATILGHLDTLIVQATAERVIDREAGVVRLTMPDGTVRGEEPISGDLARGLEALDEMKAESDRLAARIAAADPIVEKARRILRDGVGRDAEVSADAYGNVDDGAALDLALEAQGNAGSEEERMDGIACGLGECEPAAASFSSSESAILDGEAGVVVDALGDDLPSVVQTPSGVRLLHFRTVEALTGHTDVSSKGAGVDASTSVVPADTEVAPSVDPDSTVAECDDVSAWGTDSTSDFASAFDAAMRAELLAEMSRTGVTIGEVARTLNIGEGTVRNRLKGTSFRLPVSDVATIAHLVGTPVHVIARRANDIARSAAS